MLYTHAGPEIGVASTKAFITQVALLIRVAVSVAHLRGAKPQVELEALLDEMRQLPQLVEKTLEAESAVIRAAQKIQHAKSALFLVGAIIFPLLSKVRSS